MKVILRKVIDEIHVINHEFLPGVGHHEAQSALDVAQDAIACGKYDQALVTLKEVTGELAESMLDNLVRYNAYPTVEP